MPTLFDTNFAPLTNDDEFESMICDICALEWDDPNTKKFGRKGQKQYGIDVYGHPVDPKGKYRGTQCKLRTKGDQLTKKEIETEVCEARQFPHPIDALIIATDAPRDTKTQILVDDIRECEVHNGGFKVFIWFWEDITDRLATYPKLLVKYYAHCFARLTTLPIVEKLVDTPLHILCLRSISSNQTPPVEEHLRLRGVRILSPNQSLTRPQTAHLRDELPDGVLCQYNIPQAPSNDSALLKFASDVQTYERLVEPECPMFVLLSSEQIHRFSNSLQLLGGSCQRIKILVDNQPIAEIADRILCSTFDYGYKRRGNLTTIDIAARTSAKKPSAALLDLDWQTQISMETGSFPTSSKWQDTLIPALYAVKKQILNQGDKTRIQVNSQLPLPAAFALGFFFNLRVARVGVWARRTGVSDFKRQFWLSDAEPADVTYTPKWVRKPEVNSRSAIVELTTYGSIHNAVEIFAKESDLVADAWLQVQLVDSNGQTLENINESHAVAYANQVGRIIRRLNSQGITDIHLFARMPSALAVLVGQRLQACGQIHLYWFDNPTYRFAFTLK